MTLPPSTRARAPLRVDRKAKSAAKVIVKVLYGVTLLPVVMWCLYNWWVVAKQMHEFEPVRPMIPYLLLALVIPFLWTAGVAGSAILARRGRRWLLWATAFLVPLVVALVAVITPFVVYVANHKPIP